MFERLRGWGGIITFTEVEATKGNQPFFISQSRTVCHRIKLINQNPSKFFICDRYWKLLI